MWGHERKHSFHSWRKLKGTHSRSCPLSRTLTTNYQACLAEAMLDKTIRNKHLEQVLNEFFEASRDGPMVAAAMEADEREAGERGRCRPQQ